VAPVNDVRADSVAIGMLERFEPRPDQAAIRSGCFFAPLRFFPSE